MCWSVCQPVTLNVLASASSATRGECCLWIQCHVQDTLRGGIGQSYHFNALISPHLCLRCDAGGSLNQAFISSHSCRIHNAAVENRGRTVDGVSVIVLDARSGKLIRRQVDEASGGDFKQVGILPACSFSDPWAVH